MKLRGEVAKLETSGDGVHVTITNVKRNGQARWQSYGPDITIAVPTSRAKQYQIGRIVRLDLQLT